MTRGDSLENYLLLPFTDYCGHAPLLSGHYGCVEALLTWGADVDMDIPHLGTALYTACICQELECASKLLREGQFAAMFSDAKVTSYLCICRHTGRKEVSLANIAFRLSNLSRYKCEQ